MGITSHAVVTKKGTTTDRTDTLASCYPLRNWSPTCVKKATSFHKYVAEECNKNFRLELPRLHPQKKQLGVVSFLRSSLLADTPGGAKVGSGDIG